MLVLTNSSRSQDLERLLQRALDAQRDRRVARVGRVEVLEQDRELVAAEAGDEPVGAAAGDGVVGPQDAVRRRPSATSSSSPTAWLKLSLMRLKRSRSRNMTAQRCSGSRDRARPGSTTGDRGTAPGWAAPVRRVVQRAAAQELLGRLADGDVRRRARPSAAGSPSPVADRHAAGQKPAVLAVAVAHAVLALERTPRPRAGAPRRPPSGRRRRRGARARSTRRDRRRPRPARGRAGAFQRGEK